MVHGGGEGGGGGGGGRAQIKKLGRRHTPNNGSAH